MHQAFNEIELNKMDKIEIHGSKLIDIVAASYGVLEYVKGYQLLEHNEIIFIDYRSYIIDVNLEEYFKEQLSQ